MGVYKRDVALAGAVDRNPLDAKSFRTEGAAGRMSATGASSIEGCLDRGDASADAVLVRRVAEAEIAGRTEGASRDDLWHDADERDVLRGRARARFGDAG